MGGSWRQREAATHAWEIAGDRLRRSGRPFTDNKRMRLAAKVLKETAGGGDISRPGRFIKRWVERMRETGAVHDKPTRGCKSLLTPDMAKRAVDILSVGYQNEEKDYVPYVDIRPCDVRGGVQHNRVATQVPGESHYMR